MIKTDRELQEKVIGLYFARNYWSIEDGKKKDVDTSYLNEHTFKVVVTNNTKNNGYDSDKEKVKELLEIDKIYTLNDMNVGRSSSTLTIKEVPSVNFNSVNFEFVALEE